MTAPLVVLDADVLGRRRTGDETYVRNLLRELPDVGDGLRFAAVTRSPELMPERVEALPLTARSQELRMAYALPRLLRRVKPALVHTQYVLPPRLPCPAVVTIHDVSFMRLPGLFGRWDRAIFRALVPRAARRAARVLTVSERTKHDLVDLFRLPAERIVVTPNGVDPAFGPGNDEKQAYLLFVGAIQARKNPLLAAEAAATVGLPLVAVGPEKDAALARELRRRGVEVRGYVEREELAELYRGAAALLLPSRYEGFGLPVLEAMASGTPVVAAPDPALQEIADGAAVFADDGEFADGVARALAGSSGLAAAGLERARAFSWNATARRTAAVYREVLGL